MREWRTLIIGFVSICLGLFALVRLEGPFTARNKVLIESYQRESRTPSESISLIDRIGEFFAKTYRYVTGSESKGERKVLHLPGEVERKNWERQAARKVAEQEERDALRTEAEKQTNILRQIEKKESPPDYPGWISLIISAMGFAYVLMDRYRTKQTS